MMGDKRAGHTSTDLTMKGSAGRDCSPAYYQRMRSAPTKTPKQAPRSASYVGLGTPMGGKPPEASSKTSPAAGVLDPGLFNVDGHAVRAFSHYWEGKRAGPDWLHRRVEEAQERRLDRALELDRRS
jgi:hypothetical protein